jgi:hypothetical protein
MMPSVCAALWSAELRCSDGPDAVLICSLHWFADAQRTGGPAVPYHPPQHVSVIILRRWSTGRAPRSPGRRGSDDLFGRRWEDRNEPRRDTASKGLFRCKDGQKGGDIRSGGARPDIVPVAPPVVAFPLMFPTSSMVIDTGGRLCSAGQKSLCVPDLGRPRGLRLDRHRNHKPKTGLARLVFTDRNART